MVPRTRRALLGSSVALAATLAGCEGQFRKTPTETGSDIEPGSVSDPEHVVLRSPGSEPPVTVASDGPDDAELTREIVTSRDGADGLAYAADVDAAAARALVEETDFDAESIVVHATSVRECYRLELCAVSWSGEEIEMRYGSVLRDADVACRADARSSVATLVRVPVVPGPDASPGVRGDVSYRACRPSPEPTLTGTDGTTDTPAGRTAGPPSDEGGR